MNVQSKPSKLIKGATGDWEVVIGMEVHAQVTSKSKLFSGSSTEFGAAPNSHVSLVDAAMPGMLPVINAECVRQAVRTGLGLKAQINLRSVFDRKNYFYPDLPQGYQISQYKQPVVGEGEVVVDLADGEAVTIGIERLHLEQDAGKSLHDRHAIDVGGRSQPLRRGADGDRLQARPALVGGGDGLPHQAALDLALSRHLRRQYGRGSSARRRQCLGAQAGRRTRHPLRDQEHELDPLHRPGDRARGAPADRDHRGRRYDRAGDAAVRPQQGRNALDALEGRGARLPLFPRSRPVAARIDAESGRRTQSATAGTSRREESALRRGLCAVAVRRRPTGGRARDRRLFRDGGEGPRRQARRQLGDQRIVRPAEQRGQDYRGVAG